MENLDVGSNDPTQLEPQVEQAPQTFQDREKQDTHPELTNLAAYSDKLGEERLREIGEQVVEEYKIDEDSRSEWLEKQTQWATLFYQKDKPQRPPWPGSSQESMPILQEGCLQFGARASVQLFSAPRFVTAQPVGHVSRQDQERAERVADYMSWQLEVKDRSYRRNKERLLRALPLHGSVFTKTYRDPIRKRNVVETVRAIDLCVSYHNVGIDVEEVERKTHILTMPLRKGRYLESQNYFTHAPIGFSGMDSTSSVQDAIDDATGVSRPSSADRQTARILEQHRWLDLDGDGIEEPYVVWVDSQTGKVLRLTVRYRTDASGKPTDYLEPMEFFTHYTYLENPDGFYGLGLGHLTGDMNAAVNKMLRQSIDAATIQNTRPGFATRQIGIKKGPIEIELGKIIEIDGITDDIKKQLMFMDTPGPSAALVQLMEGIAKRADRLNMVTDMLTGQPDKVYQPTTAMAQIKQGLMSFSAVQSRVHHSVSQELQKLYYLNGIYMDPEEYFAVQDVQKGSQEGIAYKRDFLADLQVMPMFDPEHSLDEVKVHQAAAEMEAVMKTPVAFNSPMHQANCLRRFLVALGAENIDEIVPTEEIIKQQQEQKQQQQQEMMQMQMQEKEKEGAREDAVVKVKQQANEINSTRVSSESENKAESNRIKEDQGQQKIDLKEAQMIVDAAVESRKAFVASKKGNGSV